MEFLYLLLLIMYISKTEAKIRRYYIAAVDEDWNYAPGGNMVHDDRSISDIYLKGGVDRIGSTYTKALFREFTDDSYATPVKRPDWMGILGPLMRAEVGDEIHVHFKNLAHLSGRPFSIHPHGVLYTKANEGALYVDKTSGVNKKDDGIKPGQNYTYVWEVTPEFGPNREDPPCIPWGYHSHVSADTDIDTGLVGLLLTCQKGALLDNGSRKDLTTEYVIYMDKADENNSWMLKNNLNKCGNPRKCLGQIADPDFKKSNEMWHINGYVYGNLPDIKVTVGQKVIWYIMSLNSGIQSITFSGNTVTHRNHRLDTVPFLPSSFLSVEMIPAYSGSFLMYSRISENFAGGMQAYYMVSPPVRLATRRKRRKRQVQASTNTPNMVGVQTPSILLTGLNQQSSLPTGMNHGQSHHMVPLYNFDPNAWAQVSDLDPALTQVPLNAQTPTNADLSLWDLLNTYLSSGYPYAYSSWYPLALWNYYYPGIPFPWTARLPQRRRRPWYWNRRRSGNAGAVQRTGSRQDSSRNGSPNLSQGIPMTTATPFIARPPPPISTQPPNTKPLPQIDTSKITRHRRPAIFKNAWKRPGISLFSRTFRHDEAAHSKLPPIFTFNSNSVAETPVDSNISNTSKVALPEDKSPWTSINAGSAPDRGHHIAPEAQPPLRKKRSVTFRPGLINSFQNNRDRVYYLSIEKVLWDYGPSGLDKFNGGTLLNNTKSRLFFERGPQRIGGEYVKVMFFQYTDATFTKRVDRSIRHRHLGLLGPPILAEIGDDVTIVLRNLGDVPFSFLPYGFTFAKSQEGFYYKDKQTGGMAGKVTKPFETTTYYFTVPDVYAGPTSDDAPCITHTYQSGVNPVKDMNSGLVGPIVICRRGQLQRNVLSPIHRQSWFSANRHIYMALITVDENESWYLDENIRRYTTSQQPINKNDPDFKESNTVHSINGFVYGNLDGIDFCLSEDVIWHLMVFGGTTDMHGLYIHGQTWDEFGNNIDAKGLLPGFTATMTSRPDTIGTWSVVCRTNSHFEGGMVALYKVNECGSEERVEEVGSVRRYYIGAMEVEWDYAPLKRSMADGRPLTDINQPGGVFVVHNDSFIGSKYKKAIYREFTDDTFTTPVLRGPENEHLGIMGPFIKAEVGETIEVVFKNMATIPFSLHAQGLKYDKANEGAVYVDGNLQSPSGRFVSPGRRFTYRWSVPERAGPGISDPNCIGRMYYSSVDSVPDIYSGLFGPLVVCRRGILDASDRRMDVDREFAIMFMVIDENKSHYLIDNLLIYTPTLYNGNQNVRNNTKFTGLNKTDGKLNAGLLNNTSKLRTNDSQSTNNLPASSKDNNIKDQGKKEVNTGYNENTIDLKDKKTDNSNDNADNEEKSQLAEGARIISRKNQLFETSDNENNILHDLQKRYAHHGSTRLRSEIETTSSASDTAKEIHEMANVRHSRQKRHASSSNKSAGIDTLKTFIAGKDPALFGSAMFQHSNHMNSINGRLMGNLNGIEMNQGDKVAWYILALGSAEDYHPVHIHGQVFTRRSDRSHSSDVVEVFPSTSDTVEMLAVNPGNWILHCHFSKHAKNGMQLIYKVHPNP